MLNSLSLRERHCPDRPCLRLSHPQLSHSSVPTLELRRGSSELDQRHSCYLVTLATDLLLPNLCGKVDFSVYFSFFFFCSGLADRGAHGLWDLPFGWVCSEVAAIFGAPNEPDKLFFLRVCLHREVYHYNYTLCYTSISTLYECSYFEISVSKQSCTSVFSSVIMLANSQWRPAFRRQCYVRGSKPSSSDC